MTENNNTNNELQMVVFDLASEYYGVDISDVREIIRMQNITRVPGTPEYMEGVLNLRGKIAPVVDLRKRLNLKVNEQTKESRIVVIDIENKDVGVIVDGVTEVLRIPVSSVEPPSQMLTSGDNVHLKGIAKLQDKLVILLDMDSVLNDCKSLNMEMIRSEIEAEAADPKAKTKKGKFVAV
jgi:purine-binding chemotaxis protein CheW